MVVELVEVVVIKVVVIGVVVLEAEDAKAVVVEVNDFVDGNNSDCGNIPMQITDWSL